MINFTPEKSKQIALARLDLIHKWLEFKSKSTNKLQADYDFVKLHNTSISHLYALNSKDNIYSTEFISNYIDRYIKD